MRWIFFLRTYAHLKWLLFFKSKLRYNDILWSVLWLNTHVMSVFLISGLYIWENFTYMKRCLLLVSHQSLCVLRGQACSPQSPVNLLKEETSWLLWFSVMMWDVSVNMVKSSQKLRLMKKYCLQNLLCWCVYKVTSTSPSKWRCIILAYPKLAVSYIIFIAKTVSQVVRVVHLHILDLLLGEDLWMYSESSNIFFNSKSWKYRLVRTPDWKI